MYSRRRSYCTHVICECVFVLWKCFEYVCLPSADFIVQCASNENAIGSVSKFKSYCFFTCVQHMQKIFYPFVSFSNEWRGEQRVRWSLWMSNPARTPPFLSISAGIFQLVEEEETTCESLRNMKLQTTFFFPLYILKEMKIFPIVKFLLKWKCLRP